MGANGRQVVDRRVVAENEAAAREAFQRGDYVFCFLLAHCLVGGLLRAFLGSTGRERFDDLVRAYKRYMDAEGQPRIPFVDELAQFNRRRNRVIHNLWRYGYSETNRKLEPACLAAFAMFGLLIEWLETFEPEIADAGFSYE